MNAVLILNRVNFYCDVTRNSRFSFLEIGNAVNDAIRDFVKLKLGDEKHRNPENFQWIQTVRDDLYTLITTATPTITTGTVITNKYYSILPNHINYPADYFDFIGLLCKINGYTTYARVASYNGLGPLLEDSFKHPTNEKPYFNEDSTGFTIYRSNSGTFSTATLEYIKVPNTFTLSNESNLISTGGTLTNGASYIALEVSVQNSTTYQIGTQFTAVGTSLTSGQVILASLTTTVDLPEKVQDEICKRAAEILMGITQSTAQFAVNKTFVREGT